MNRKLLCLLPLAALTLFGCSPRKSVQPVTTAKNEIKVVKVIKAQKENFIRTRTISAQTSAYEDITISSESNGKVEWMGVSEGDNVYRGQTLAKIDEKMVRAQYNVASANYNLAKNNLDRQAQLFEKKLISDMQYDQARTQLETAKSALDLAAIQLQNTSINAPIRGIVAAKFINENELTNMGRPILRLVNLDTIKVVIDMVEQDMINLKHNQAVQVQVPSLGIEKYLGRINKIGSVADPKNKTFPVEVLLANANHRIKSGMVCSVTFTLDQINQVVVIPQDLIVEGENARNIMVVSGNMALLKSIRVSDPEKGKVAILNGINAGETIISIGSKSVSNGDKVQAIEVTSYENN